MRGLKIALAAILGLVLIVLWIAPIGPMPGIFIGGTATPAPATWSDTSDVHEIRLKVPGTPPRVVIIWLVEHEGELHVVGSKNSGWVQRIGAGAPVEMRLGDSTYSLRASPVVDGWKPILRAYVAKYEPDYPELVASFPEIGEASETVAVFRLDRS